MIELEKRDDLQPLCPHCKQPVGAIYFREVRGMLGKRYVYFCSACKSVLGVSHRKGLLMG